MSALSPLEIARFLDLGYLVLRLEDVEDSIHDRIFHTCEALYKGMSSLPDSNVGFNLIADDLNTNIPELSEIHGSKELNGALSSLLGPRYFRYNHSYIHRSSGLDQSYHKDSGLPWGTRNGIRSHRLNWAMAFYYPQDTTIELGPTEILPGTQYWSIDREKPGATAGEDRLDLKFEADGVHNNPDLSIRDARLQQNVLDFDAQTEPLRLEIPKGSVVLVHFDLFHRGARRSIDESRYMLKFWYVRTEEPEYHKTTTRVTYQCKDPRRELVLSSCLDWLGVPVEVEKSFSASECTKTEGDATIVANAYKSARLRDKTLLQDFVSDNEALRRAATQALTTTDDFGLKTAFANTRSESHTVRMSGAFLLGEIAKANDEVLDVLCCLSIQDPEIDVRVTAINALGRLTRRNSDQDVTDFDRVIQNLIEVISRSELRPSRRLPMACPSRQAAYIALLSAVGSVSLDQHGRTLNNLAEFLESSLSKEEDRYAKGTAVELVCRLAQMGIPTATKCAIRLLRNERVNSIVQYA